MGSVNLLLDTCSFLWLSQQPREISFNALEAINHTNSKLFLSDASVWEITLKHFKGGLPLPESPRIWIPEKLLFHQVENVILDHEHFFRSCELQDHHPDPFDRLIAAQAIEGGMTILSPDYSFSKLGASRLW
jgi:PIN domain nuclease of toxin-antitoxin system